MIDFVTNKELEDNNHIFVEIIKASSVKELIKKIDKQKGGVVVQGSSDSINQFCVESKKVDILLHPESERTKDFMKARDAGLNQVLAKEAAKNKVAIGISIYEILNTNQKEHMLGRIIQNIQVCRQYHVPMVLANFSKTKEELRNKD